MPLYESVYIARSDISPSQVDALTEQMKKIVEENGGTVAKTEYWGVKSLAYRIKKNRKGHYTLLNLDAPAAALKELERNLRLNEDVVRYMSIRVDELEEGPSIMMQNRSSRGRDRDRDRGDRAPAAATKQDDKESPAETPSDGGEET